MYLSKHAPLKVVIEDISDKELLYLVDGYSKYLIKQFNKVLAGM